MVYARALARAAEILGSTDALQAYLQVRKADLGRWMRGEGKPPDHIFLRVADLLFETKPFQDGGSAEAR